MGTMVKAKVGFWWGFVGAKISSTRLEDSGIYIYTVYFSVKKQLNMTDVPWWMLNFLTQFFVTIHKNSILVGRNTHIYVYNVRVK